MTTKKSLKSALVVSGLSMLLCGAMLAGTTFAWFSDTATSGPNTITAGNLQVQLQYDSDPAQENEGDWKNAQDVKLFSFDEGDSATKWEPGMMFYSKPFRIANTGNLALTYKVSVNMEDTVKTEEGDHGLSDVIKSVIVPLATFTENQTLVTSDTADRAKAWEAFDKAKVTFEDTQLTTGKQSDVYIAVLYWQEGATDDLYNGAVGPDGATLTTTFSINVEAKQAPVEEDSVGSDYDNGATYPSD